MTLAAAPIDRFRSSLRGRVVTPADDVPGPEAIYGPAKAERLRALKRTRDPDNVFRPNHYIAPWSAWS